MRNYIEELEAAEITEEKITATKDKKMNEWFSKLKKKDGSNLKYAFDNLIKKYNKITVGAYSCGLCNFKTTNERSWRQHISSPIHIARDNDYDIVKCKGCGRDYPDGDDYKKHIIGSKSCALKNNKINDERIELVIAHRKKIFNKLHKRIKDGESKDFNEKEKDFYNLFFPRFNTNFSDLELLGLVDKIEWGLYHIKPLPPVALDFS